MSLKFTEKFLGCKTLGGNTEVWKILISEFLGTMILVLFGCGASIPWTKSISDVQIALAAGFTVATIVQFTGHISGGHINPAVSLAMLITGKMSLIMYVLYVFCQSVGAIAGALLLKIITPVHLQINNFAVTTIDSNVISEVKGFGVEFLITFVMVMTAFSVSDSNRNDVKGSVPLAIGLSVTISHFLALHFTGCSMNPARSFGPALIFNNWNHHWIYWVGPCCGAVTAGVLYQLIFQSAGDLKDNMESVNAVNKNKNTTETINL